MARRAASCKAARAAATPWRPSCLVRSSSRQSAAERWSMRVSWFRMRVSMKRGCNNNVGAAGGGRRKAPLRQAD